MYATTAIFHACESLAGEKSVTIKTHKELHCIGQNTNNGFLIYHNFLSEMMCSFYARDYIKVMALSEQIPYCRNKRSIASERIFFEGLASMCLARQTHQPKWEAMGNEAFLKMSKLKMVRLWTFIPLI